MLFADKNALRTQLKVNMLRIRERELTYYTNNCLAISTSSALLAQSVDRSSEVFEVASHWRNTFALKLSTITELAGLEVPKCFFRTSCRSLVISQNFHI